MLTIIVRPAGMGRFAACLGRRELCVSRTPLLTSARLLIAEGLSPETMLAMKHSGSRDVALIKFGLTLPRG
jgi:hypothetical protein